MGPPCELSLGPDELSFGSGGARTPLALRDIGVARVLVGTGFDPEVGAATRGTGASLTRRYHRCRHRFISPEDDSGARVTFDLAQSAVDVQIDDVGLHEGRGCGTP